MLSINHSHLESYLEERKSTISKAIYCYLWHKKQAYTDKNLIRHSKTMLHDTTIIAHRAEGGEEQSLYDHVEADCMTQGRLSLPSRAISVERVQAKLHIVQREHF